MSWEDWQECTKHRWRFKPSGRGSAKEYLVRNRHVNWKNGGMAKHNRTQQDYFLHTFILEERMGLPRPSKAHICDHRNGVENDCTRGNLRWATKRFNALNVRGIYSGVEFDQVAVMVGSRPDIKKAVMEIEKCLR